MRFGKLNLEENFQRKKNNQNIVGIRNRAHSFDEPVQLPLGHRDTAVEFRLNHTVNVQLILAFPIS